jgi:putative Mg2+ transporter-C (MgtC) family protein
MIATWELLLRIATGAALGGVIGYERDLHGRPVGLRTHLLVAMASATFMVISTHFGYWQHYGKDDLIALDPSRIASAVVSAVGFLAGGAILRTGITVQGLTTAAGLWLVTAIGMCAGAGMYTIGVVVTGLGVAALTVLRRFEDKNDHLLRRRITVVVGGDADGLERVLAAMSGVGVSVSSLEYERRLDDEKKPVVALFDAQFSDSLGVPRLVRILEQVPGVRRVRVTNHV